MKCLLLSIALISSLHSPFTMGMVDQKPKTFGDLSLRAQELLAAPLQNSLALDRCIETCREFRCKLLFDDGTQKENGYGSVMRSWKYLYPYHKGTVEALCLVTKERAKQTAGGLAIEFASKDYALAVQLKQIIEEIKEINDKR
jgi:hypothetical protein